MATKKDDKKTEKLVVASAIVFVLLVVAILIAGAILFGLGINQIANGNIVAGFIESLVGFLLLSVIIPGDEK